MHVHTHTFQSLVCLSTACLTGCDFDTIGDYCGWTPETENPEILGFDQWLGPSETEGTGPDDDFSKPGCKPTQNTNRGQQAPDNIHIKYNICILK